MRSISRVSVMAWTSSRSGELDLGHAFVARQVGDRAPLGLRQAERLQPAIEVAPQQTGQVVDQETEVAIVIRA